MFHTAGTPEAEYSDTLELDLATVEPSLAGPKRPQDRVPLQRGEGRRSRRPCKVMLEARPSLPAEAGHGHGDGDDRRQERAAARRRRRRRHGRRRRGPGPPRPPPIARSASGYIDHGSVVIAAITSCTNTSNPSVMVAAGLLAKKAVEKGLTTKPWVKTSLAPGSKVVTDYLDDAGLTPYLDKLRFNLVGYGCTTCIGNSGPLSAEISKAIHDDDLVAAAVLCGNRNFEGRINSDVRANYLASPPLVVAYALAGTMDIDLHDRAARQRHATASRSPQGHLADPGARSRTTIRKSVRAEMFHKEYGEVFKGDERWNALDVPQGDLYEWDDDSTYVKNPPYFDGMTDAAAAGRRDQRAPACWRCWATASRPTTSRRPARSRCRARRAGT